MTAQGVAQEPPSTRRRRVNIWYLLLGAAALAALVPAVGLLQPPSSVDRVTVENPTDYDIQIAVAGGDTDHWTGIGTARRRSTTDLREITDQGEVWTFRFRAQGQDGGTLRVEREQLERDGWRIAIPDSTGQELAENGAAPPP